MRFLAVLPLSLLALPLAGCAATTPPPRLAPISPADVDGPEAVTPPAGPTLAHEPETQAATAGAAPATGNEGHHMPPRRGEPHAGQAPAHHQKAAPEAESYTCTMHPEVSEPGPGGCPKCGMPLVKRDGGETRR